MRTTTSIAALTLLAAACGSAMADEYVAVPQAQCTDQQVVVQQPTSGGGALLGAIVGGVVGHNLGGGFGRGVTTGLGAVAGSVIGNNIEASNTPAAVQTVRTCAPVATVAEAPVVYAPAPVYAYPAYYGYGVYPYGYAPVRVAVGPRLVYGGHGFHGRRF